MLEAATLVRLARAIDVEVAQANDDLRGIFAGEAARARLSSCTLENA